MHNPCRRLLRSLVRRVDVALVSQLPQELICLH